MRYETLAKTYQEGAHVKALIKAILVALSRILEIVFSFHDALPRCDHDRPLFALPPIGNKIRN